MHIREINDILYGLRFAICSGFLFIMNSTAFIILFLSKNYALTNSPVIELKNPQEP